MSKLYQEWECQLFLACNWPWGVGVCLSFFSRKTVYLVVCQEWRFSTNTEIFSTVSRGWGWWRQTPLKLLHKRQISRCRPYAINSRKHHGADHLHGNHNYYEALVRPQALLPPHLCWTWCGSCLDHLTLHFHSWKDEQMSWSILRVNLSGRRNHSYHCLQN